MMATYNLIQYNANYSKTFEILWQYCTDELILNPAYNPVYNTMINFNAHFATTNLFKVKQKTKCKTGNNGTEDVEIMVPLKYLSKCPRTQEMPLINCKINFDLNWSKKQVIVANNPDQATFLITDTKLYVPVVTLSTQDNAKLLEQLKSGFKRTTDWNKYQSKKSIEIPNKYLDQLIDY